MAVSTEGDLDTLLDLASTYDPAATKLGFLDEDGGPEFSFDVDDTLSTLQDLASSNPLLDVGIPCDAQSLSMDAGITAVPWTVESSPSKPRRRPAPSRKEEIMELRKTVKKLSKTLEVAKAAFGGVPDKQKPTLAVLDKSPWKDRVDREFEHRKISEMTNATLRREIIDQAHNAANLKRMLKRRYDEEMLEIMPVQRRSKEGNAKMAKDNERIFQELFCGIDQVYAGVDGLFKQKDMQNFSGHKKYVYPNVVNGTFLEIMHKNHVPFSMTNAVTAVWKALGGRKAQDGAHVQAKMCAQMTEQADTTMTNYFSYTCCAEGYSNFVQERFVAKKFVDKNRAVFVCRVRTEPKSRSLVPLGLRLQELNIIVVRKGQGLASGQECAVIEMCLQVTRSDEGKQEALQFRAPTYSKIAVKGYDTKLKLYSQRIENILFDESLATVTGR